jgi:hypothetical protein
MADVEHPAAAQFQVRETDQETKAKKVAKNVVCNRINIRFLNLSAFGKYIVPYCPVTSSGDWPIHSSRLLYGRHFDAKTQFRVTLGRMSAAPHP